ncbi:precorrin-3B synthase [Ancylobacter pratisalsi]|uniref:Precorrin-3B synthase n=1 Tax=Ancylobacter pratisalsi TaxID=1745854 RepID=A0A6P1YI67_9HYPH|nr:precorrin-3B synthase [Ancylobacter pratisalsi]QIB33028.1 precorrin-3B synthase [Ancylobacter pratisalsi]
MSAASVRAMRRGACPSLPAPMQTGDGLLARLQPMEPLTLDQLAGLAALASELGNAIVEVTARGKLQLRGLTPASAPHLAAGVDALGIEVQPGFPVETSALAGLDPAEVFDPRPLAQAISNAASGLVPGLAPKVSVVVDGGGSQHLRALKADIAVTAGGGGRLLVRLAGVAAGEVVPEWAVTSVVGLLEQLAACGPAARMAELVAREGIDALRASAGLTPAADRACPPAEPVGVHSLTDGTLALGLGLGFGQVEAGALAGLAAAARDAGARCVEPASGRALLVIGLAPETARQLRATAEGLGFITDPQDVRRRVIACSGAPACGSARMETHALAAALAGALAPSIAHGDVHVSGCAKGCAHPARALVTIVGLDEGMGLVVEGTPRDVSAQDVLGRDVPVARLAEMVREMLRKTSAMKKDPA